MHLNDELRNDGLTFNEAYEMDEYKSDLKEWSVRELGYFLEPSFLFSTIVEKARLGEFILDDLKNALNEISSSSMGYESQHAFYNIFEDVDLDSSKLGKAPEDKNRIISDILISLSEIDFNVDNESYSFGNAFECLIIQFASIRSKISREFYTPLEVSVILAKIVSGGKTHLINVFDPTCGTGSSLLRVGKEVDYVGCFYGQELNPSTYNLARMNFILHGVKYGDFDIRQGDSLEDPQHLGIKFEAIVANPPFSAKWSSDRNFLDDERFSDYGKLAPKSKADYAFVQHMLYHLDENGIMAVVLPHGVLFRGAAEQKIRKYLIENNFLDAVIGLPANMFYGTAIPTCVLVFKKSRRHGEPVLFIDSSKHFKRNKNRSRLRHEDIYRIIRTYENRDEIDKFSHNAGLDEIRRNDFNLNIPRYVNTFEEKEPVNLDKVYMELKKVSREIEKVDIEIDECCDKLGIKSPIFRKI
jgi:type I restriction enzyme M protein